MKPILTFVLLLTVSVTFAQKHYIIPVEELDSLASKDSTTAFNHHPIQLEVEVNYSSNSWDTLSVMTTLTYYEDFHNTPFYKAKNTATISVLALPVAMDLKTAVNPDGSYNLDHLNAILRLFGLKYRTIPVQFPNPQTTPF